MWSGLGINYGAQYVAGNVASDMAFLFNVGFRKIRISIPDYGNATSIANSLDMCAKARSAGFTHIICGVTAINSHLNATSETAFHDALVSNATSFAATGNVDEFQMGNEETLHCSDASLTNVQIVNLIAGWFSDVKAVAGSMKVSYATNNGDVNTWINNQPTNPFDIISANLYGFQTPQITGVRAYFDIYAQNFFNTYSPNCFVSEFNINPQSSWWTAVPANMTDTQRYDEVNARKKKLRSIGFTSAYYYTYTTSGDDFAAKLQSGTFRRLWYALLSQRPPVVNTRTFVTRTAVSSRPAVSRSAI